jgi:hypothetical protein
VARKPAPPVIFHAEDDRYGPHGVEADRPFPIARDERVRCDGFDIQIFDGRIPGNLRYDRAIKIVVAFRDTGFQ